MSSVPGQSSDPLAAVVAALARRDGVRALVLLPAAREAAGDDVALQARVAAWHAQALQLQSRLDEAHEACTHALRLARSAGEARALAPLRKLHADITSQRAALAVATGTPLPDSALGRAAAAVDSGAPDALELCDVALTEAGEDPREQVLALLTRARLPGEADQAVRKAARIADEVSDMNLVTAVARAARAAGVELPVYVF